MKFQIQVFKPKTFQYKHFKTCLIKVSPTLPMLLLSLRFPRSESLKVWTSDPGLPTPTEDSGEIKTIFIIKLLAFLSVFSGF